MKWSVLSAKARALAQALWAPKPTSLDRTEQTIRELQVGKTAITALARLAPEEHLEVLFAALAVASADGRAKSSRRMPIAWAVNASPHFSPRRKTPTCANRRCSCFVT